MARSVTLFADDDIAVLLEKKLEEDGRFRIDFRARNYSACFAPSLVNRAEAMILQIESPVAYSQNLTYEMEMADYFPALLMFERCGDGSIRYVLADEDLIPLSKELGEAFEAALGEAVPCSRTYYRTTVWNDNVEDFIATTGRQEALKEILRGCSAKELDIHRAKYDLDLRDNGYYLFFWQLNYVSYMEHRSYKDIYNFIGETLKKECKQIIDSFAGGEVFYSRINQLCIFINDMPSKSEAQRSTRFEGMISRLATATGAKKATRYLSPRTGDTGGFHLEFKRYLQERPNNFFLRDVPVMRSTMLTNRAPKPENTELNALLDKICSYIRYDIQNVELTENLRRLFFDVIKPAMDFPSYYYSMSVISHALARFANLPENGELSEALNPDFLQYSSLESQYNELLAAVKNLGAQSSCKRQTRSSLVMKAMDFIATNYRENLTVADISRALFVSSTHLSQVFKSMLGVSLIQYLINYRIEEAKKLLENTDLMVYSVAEMVGFPDFRHFSKTFHKNVGVSPTEYRRRHNRKG